MLKLLKEFIEVLINFFLSTNFIIIFTLIIVFYHFILFFIRDKRYIDVLKRIKVPKNIKLEDLEELPIVNIIIPAWKEGIGFKKCLSSIKDLTYPHLKIIINAGGSERTLKIASSFEKFSNFKILYQKHGEGKIKAINDCLKHVTEGIVHLIDADVLLTNEILLDMIYYIINENYDVVISHHKPSKSISNKSMVIYSYINRNIFFRLGFRNFLESVGPNTSMKYEVLNQIGRFTEKNLLDDGRSIGLDIISHGFKILSLNHFSIEIYSYPLTIKEYFNQNIRWIENSLFFFMKNEKSRLFRFIILVLISIYILISPIFIFFNLFLFIYGILFLFSIYLKKIRKIVFYRILDKSKSFNIKPHFYFKIILYIILDLIINIYVFLEILFYRKAYKKRKNLI